MHIHWYKFVFRKGANRYYQCRCGARRVRHDEHGYSPLDRDWLKRGQKVKKVEK